MTEQSAIVAGVDLGDADLAATVRGGLAEVEKQLVAELSAGEDFLTEAALHLVSAGGKRFRPLFTLLTAQVGPNPDAGEVFTAATVVELVHLATLYHDDVMDEATMRRGAPSANARWGNSVAILAGDYLFAHASRLVSTLGPEAVRVIADTFAELVTGQMRETVGARGEHDPVEHYLEGDLGEDGLADRRLRPLRRHLLRRPRRSGHPARGTRQHRRHRVPDLRRHHRHLLGIRPVRQDARHRPARGRAHAADAATRCARRARRPTGCGCCSTGPSPTTTTSPRPSTCSSVRTGMAAAKSRLAEYADRAEAELDALPPGPANAALRRLVRFTIERVG